VRQDADANADANADADAARRRRGRRQEEDAAKQGNQEKRETFEKLARQLDGYGTYV
jgi:hypothetical protein